MRYLRLWKRFFIISLARMMEYRLNFVISLIAGLAELALGVLTFLLIYQFTPSIAGWSRADALLLLGIYRIVDGIISTQISPNMQAISGYIQRGDMDFVLLWPVSSQFTASARLMNLSASANILTGLALTIYAGNSGGVEWTAAGILAAALFVTCGLVILYCLWLFIVTFSFWLVQVGTLDTLFYSVFVAARYPVSFFKGIVRALLTFVVPVAFATTFPAEALRGTVNVGMLVVGLALACVGLLCTHLFWSYAVRHYSSASS